MSRAKRKALSAAEVQAVIRSGLPEAEVRGLCVEAITPRGAIVRHPYSADSLRPGGTLSGPTMMALADAAMYAALLAHYDETLMAVTSQMTIHFLRRPPQGDLVGEAELLRVGGRSAVIEVRIHSPASEELVAVASGIYALPTPRAD